jgi:hypothetical protein
MYKRASLNEKFSGGFFKIANPAHVAGLFQDAGNAALKGASEEYVAAMYDKARQAAAAYDMGNFANPETLSNIGLAGGLVGAGGLAGLAYKNRANAYNPGALARLFGAKAKGGVDSRVLGALAGAGAGAAGLRALPMLQEIGMDDIRAYREASNSMMNHVQNNLDSF